MVLSRIVDFSNFCRPHDSKSCLNVQIILEMKISTVTEISHNLTFIETFLLLHIFRIYVFCSSCVYYRIVNGLFILVQKFVTQK